MLITMPIQWDQGWHEVEAEIVDIAPHLASAASFCIHRNPMGSCRIGDWSITNVETGLHIITGDTFAGTLESAKIKLRTKTLRHIKRGFGKALMQFPQLSAEANRGA